MFSYDPVGNFERESWRSAGSASHLIQPFLDNQVNSLAFLTKHILTDHSIFHTTNQIGKKHQSNVPHTQLTEDEVVKIVKDAFTSATERDIYTGDYLEVFVIKKDGVKVTRYELKKD